MSKELGIIVGVFVACVLIVIAVTPGGTDRTAEKKAELAAMRAVKDARGLAPPWMVCDNTEGPYFHCEGSTSVHDGSLPIDLKVERRNNLYRVYDLRI